MTQIARTTTRKAYLVLGCKTWDRRVYDETLASLPGKWRYVGSPDELSAALVRNSRRSISSFFTGHGRCRARLSKTSSVYVST